MQLPKPPFRRLRGYAYDPSLSLRLDTSIINATTFELPWESVEQGPVGEYVEVVDYDPATGCWYEPVDLNAPELLAQDGLPPSEGTPQFHQQMVYAVASNTIRNFEQALGRKVLWAPRDNKEAPSGKRDEFVRRLRIYPHAMRAANAYYSPEKKALLFGYFPGPSGMVFTCLSHDIVAHETTHALLDGMQRRYVEDNHQDTLAFHEAFADLVAMFQHFTFHDVLRHQIERTRGDLAGQSLLGELAQQFGEATGRYGALRSAIGKFDKNGVWEALKPDPSLLATMSEPHDRGAILVAAVFRAFLSIYRAAVADLLRLATAGRGVLEPGSIHPDLVNRLAEEANKVAHRFLRICIRAIDYCPPVDVTFGDYLRALVTADYDMVPSDPHGYRVAIIESFRQWGIVPEGVRTHSEEYLRWNNPQFEDPARWNAFSHAAKNLRQVVGDSLYFTSRQEMFDKLTNAQRALHDDLETLLSDKSDRSVREEFEKITGLVLSESSSLDGLRIGRSGTPGFEVHAIRPALRVSPTGDIHKQVIITITQRRLVPLNPDEPEGDKLNFRGGSTLILDLESMTLRYAITRSIRNEGRLERVRKYRRDKAENDLSLRATYFGAPATENGESPVREPFALLHSEE